MGQVDEEVKSGHVVPSSCIACVPVVLQMVEGGGGLHEQLDPDAAVYTLQVRRCCIV
jgi:hypothetical protein